MQNAGINNNNILTKVNQPMDMHNAKISNRVNAEMQTELMKLQYNLPINIFIQPVNEGINQESVSKVKEKIAYKFNQLDKDTQTEILYQVNFEHIFITNILPINSSKKAINIPIIQIGLIEISLKNYEFNPNQFKKLEKTTEELKEKIARQPLQIDFLPSFTKVGDIKKKCY